MINEYNINTILIIYIMLVRKLNGDIIEINKYDYINDYIYYKKILEIKQSFSKAPLNNNNKLNYSSINNILYLLHH
jgi:hypothetical protein